VQEKEILKELLLIELEDMKSFDEDPMGFILRKYVSLNEIMIELMTRSYRDYLYGVYIVAPKPTTFKIVLHNKQYFYLMYLGPTYQASVAGKNYYLSDLGEKERCIVAISKILRGGAPINTKGPDGAEKGAKDETGGDGGGGSTSGGGGGAQGGGEEESTPSPEAEGGEEGEELTESAKAILKLLLEQTIKKDQSVDNASDTSDEKSSEDTPSDNESKKKSKLPQTPILSKNSLSPQKLGLGGQTYKSAKEILGVVKESVKASVSGENENQVNSTKNFILSLCKDVIDNTNSITESSIGDFSDVIKFSDETVQASLGVNRTDLHKVIGIEFGEVLGAMYLSKKISSGRRKAFFPKDQNNPIYDFKLGRIVVSSKYKKGAASSLTEVMDENTKQKNVGGLSEYAKSLLDIFQESYKKGVAISYLYLAKKLKDPEFNRAFTSLERALQININVDEDGETIKNQINDRLEEIRRKDGDSVLTKKLNEFYKAIGRKQIPEGQQVKWNQLPKKGEGESQKIIYYGLITSPIAYFLTDVINKQKQESGEKQALSDLIRNTEVTLIRLNFSLKDKSTQFVSQSTRSQNAKFVFHPKVTSNQPEKGFMSFRME